MAEPTTDRPEAPPWLEDVKHLAVVLDELAQQVPRAVEAGVPPGEIAAALGPLAKRLGQIHMRLWEELQVRQIRAEVDAWGAP